MEPCASELWHTSLFRSVHHAWEVLRQYMLSHFSARWPQLPSQAKLTGARVTPRAIWRRSLSRASRQG
eukprot:scaffold65317_cov36-Phaeocystis_antarctica.AAC.3